MRSNNGYGFLTKNYISSVNHHHTLGILCDQNLTKNTQRPSSVLGKNIHVFIYILQVSLLQDRWVVDVEIITVRGLFKLSAGQVYLRIGLDKRPVYNERFTHLRRRKPARTSRKRRRRRRKTAIRSAWCGRAREEKTSVRRKIGGRLYGGKREPSAHVSGDRLPRRPGTRGRRREVPKRRRRHAPRLRRSGHVTTGTCDRRDTSRDRARWKSQKGLKMDARDYSKLFFFETFIFCSYGPKNMNRFDYFSKKVSSTFAITSYVKGIYNFLTFPIDRKFVIKQCAEVLAGIVSDVSLSDLTTSSHRSDVHAALVQ